MRNLFLIATLALGLQAAQNGGAIEGTVIRSDGTGPIGEADIYLSRGGAAAGPAPVQARVGTTVSDALGRFAFNNIPAGAYTVTVQHPKYFRATNNSRDSSQSVVVTTGASTQVRISMIPAAVIRGRVRDTFGQFLSNAVVEAFSVGYRNGIPRLERVVSKVSDDRGEYRLFGLPPGDYYIGMMPGAVSAIAAASGATGLRTFYPDVINVVDAMRFTIHGGEDIANVDIGAQTTPLYKVSGRVSTTLKAAPAPPTAQGAFAIIQQNQNNTIQLLLVSRDLNTPDDGDRPGASVSVTASSTGQFEIGNVRPGSYELLALFGDDQGVPGIARTIVDIRNQDVGGLALTVRSGVQLKGTITIDGRGADPAAAKISFEPADALRKLGAFFSGTIAPGGEFSVPGAPEGLFRIRVTGLLPTLYVEDIRQGSTSIYDNGLEIRGSSPDSVQIIVKSGAGVLEGTAQDSAGKGVAGASVVLVPVTRRSNPDLYYKAAADSAGNFRLPGVAPGDYKLFAWENIPDSAWLNATFLEKYEERGVRVTTTPSARSTSNVTVSPR